MSLLKHHEEKAKLYNISVKEWRERTNRCVTCGRQSCKGCEILCEEPVEEPSPTPVHAKIYDAQ